MKFFIVFFILFTNILFSASIDSLLKEYESTSANSLQTVDEKLDYVLMYSQQDIKLMQYNKLSDILKELPLGSLNKNRFGLASPSLAGSKTTTSGFTRFFINDHEISSAYDQSPSLSWGDLPLAFVDHIEVYFGESSFALGNETGIFFIRIYTKSAIKENGGEVKSTLSSSGSNSQSITHSQFFENGWSYLLFLNKDKVKDTMDYKSNTLKNNGNRSYLYLDVSNETTSINIGYTDVKKDNYMGLSLDLAPDSGQIQSKDYFIDVTKFFLEDKSIKANFSIDINEREYDETNAAGIGVMPVFDLAHMGTTIPKEFSENLKFTKINLNLSKSTQYKNNTILTAINIKNKKYTVNDRTTLNFLNQTTQVGGYNDFDEETVSSLLFQDDYKVNEKLVLLANAKVDTYKRSGYLEDSNEKLFRVGMIYTPFENFGLKSFYTQTYLPPSFYNVDFVDKNNLNIQSQKYKFYTLEAVFTAGNSKFRAQYNNVKIDDFMYLTPVGFINIDHTVKTDGLILDYEYNFTNKNKLHLNYYTTRLSEQLNNSSKGGYAKFMGEYKRFEYFASVIYKNSYQFQDVYVRNSFDLSVGATYNFTKDLSCSIKGVNLLDKSTKSLYLEGFPGTSVAFDDYDRSVSLTMKWVF